MQARGLCGFVVWGELIIDRSIGRWCFFSGHAKCIGLLLICKSLSQLTLDQPGDPKRQSQPADFVSTEASPPANPNPAWGTWMTKRRLSCWLWKSGNGAVLISILQFSPCVLLLVAFSWLLDSEENSWNLTDASTLMNYIMDSWVLNFVWTKRKLFHFFLLRASIFDLSSCFPRFIQGNGFYTGQMDATSKASKGETCGCFDGENLSWLIATTWELVHLLKEKLP